MDLQAFKNTLSDDAPPEGLSLALQVMWQDAQKDWETAHTLSQADLSSDGSWVHAYLHRVEGDMSNARGWYSRAGKPFCEDSLEAEWDAIVTELLTR